MLQTETVRPDAPIMSLGGNVTLLMLGGRELHQSLTKDARVHFWTEKSITPLLREVVGECLMMLPRLFRRALPFSEAIAW